MTSSAEHAVRALVVAALTRIEETGLDLRAFRGIALHDQQKDELFTSLDEFLLAEEAIIDLTHFRDRYGPAESRRVTLQLVYELVDRLSDSGLSVTAFEGLWSDFLAELAEPDWIYRSVANLRCFSAKDGPFEFDDGVSIRGRSFEELAKLGFDERLLNALADDWSGFGASSYVILVETRRAKSPENFVLGSVGVDWTNAQRVLSALRLVGPGDISMGRMWIARPSTFNVGLRGLTAYGFTIQGPGSAYELTETIGSQAVEIYRALKSLEEHGYGGAPGNLDLALRSFTATYDRWPSGDDSRVLDAMTALEAVLGSGTEIAFKLSFRTAGILAESDAERIDIFETMKKYSSTAMRSGKRSNRLRSASFGYPTPGLPSGQ